MRRTFWGLIIVAGLLLISGVALAQKSYNADTFNISARIEEGGSLQVQEQVTFRFQGGPFTFVFRELPRTYNDGIVDITAGVDGQLWLPGTGPGQVEISGSDPVRVTWHLPQSSDAVHTFDLNYRMMGAVRQESGADVLKWWPLPDQYEYQIDQSQVTIDYPEQVALLPATSISPGQVTNQPGRVTVATGSLAPNTPLELELHFPAGSLIATPPDWQVQEAEQETLKDQQEQQGLWWLLGSAVLLLLGTAGAILAKHRLAPNPPRPQGDQGNGLVYSPPAELAPAIAGLLRSSSGTPAWNHAQGTLFDLAGRGLVAIEQTGEKKWYGSPTFTIRLLEWPVGLWPHEQALLELIFSDGKGKRTKSVKLTNLGKVITSSRWKIFSESLKAEVKSAGLWSKQRESARSKLTFVGFGFMALTIICLPLIIIFFDQIGFWGLAIMVCLALLSIAWIIAGTAIGIWSAAGEKMAAEWEPFYRYLKAVTQGKAAPSHPEEFELYLPYAAAYGQLHQWAKRFEKKGWSETPAYFRVLEGTDQPHMAAFVAMTAATSASGGSAAGAGAAAGAAGAGAAGGGASGAG